jgi:hypothetical protein
LTGRGRVHSLTETVTLHPAHILLGSPNGSWNAYVPGRHLLGRLDIDPVNAAALRAKTQKLFQTEDATLVALLSDSDQTNSPLTIFEPRVLELERPAVLGDRADDVVRRARGHLSLDFLRDIHLRPEQAAILLVRADGCR